MISVRAELDAMAEPLVHPQEHGARLDIREAEFHGSHGRVRVASDPAGPLLHMRAGHHYDADLERASLASQLRRRDTTELHLDVAPLTAPTQCAASRYSSLPNSIALTIPRVCLF